MGKTAYRSQLKRKQKKYVRYIYLDYNNEISPWDEVLLDLGCTLYECPVDDTGFFVANFDLTEDWLFKNANRFDIKIPRGWKPVKGETLSTPY